MNYVQRNKNKAVLVSKQILNICREVEITRHKEIEMLKLKNKLKPNAQWRESNTSETAE
jgi:hypothetical protein